MAVDYVRRRVKLYFAQSGVAGAQVVRRGWLESVTMDTGDHSFFCT